MYQVFNENRERLTREEMKTKYDGKWLYIVNMEGPFEHDNGFGQMVPCPFSAGEIYIISDEPFPGDDELYTFLSDRHLGASGQLDLRIGLRTPHIIC